MKPKTTWTLASVVILLSLAYLAGCPGAGGGHGNIDSYTLDDTGITTCADTTGSGLTCPQTGYPNQDAETGRDVNHNDDSDGHAGFSFTKLDASGKELASTASSWSCVQDKVTGLTWEVKTASGLHNSAHTYTWYSSDSGSNGGEAGTQNGGICIDSNCDTQAFIQAVNSAGLCGHKDWRLPTIHELLSIVDYSAASPSIDINYFPNTYNGRYWSSDSGINADINGVEQNARAIQFASGHHFFASYTDDKSSANYVRLVHD